MHACAISCPLEDGCLWKQPEYSAWISPKHWANSGNGGNKINAWLKEKCGRDNIVTVQVNVPTSLYVELATISDNRSNNRKGKLVAVEM